MEVILITIFAVTFILLLKLTGKTRQERLLDTLPGPNGYPLFGNFFDILNTKQNFLKLSMENEAKFGGIFKTWIGSTPIVHISKVKYVEAILTTTGISRQLDKKSVIMQNLKVHPFNYLKNRNICAKAFNSIQAQFVINSSNNNSKILVDLLKSNKYKDDVLHLESITLCVLDIICGKVFRYQKIILGVKLNSQLGVNQLFANSVMKLKKLIDKNHKVRFYSDSLFRMTSFGKEHFFHLNVIQEFLNKIIQEKYEMISNFNMNTMENREILTEMSVLDYLLTFNEFYTISDIQNEILNIIISTMDSTDISIYSTIYIAAHQLDVQDKILREITTKSAKKRNDFITIKKLQQMLYLDRVVRESLRLFPPCPIILKELEKDTKIGNHLIPNGTTICIQIINLHRDPDSFPSRDNFDPDNFLPKRMVKRSKFSYIPYGPLPGNCIGQQITEIIQRVVILNLISSFEITKFETSIPNDYFTSLNSCINYYKSNIKLKFFSRST